MIDALQLLGVQPLVWSRLIPAVLGILIVLFVVVFVLIVVVLSLVQKLTQVLTGRPSNKRVEAKGQHVLVTGGSSGIGLEVARIYLKKGYRVTIVARNLGKLVEAKEDLKKTYSKPDQFDEYFQYVSLDLGSNEEIVKAGLASPIAKFGDVEIIVNCAGTSVAGTFESLDPKEFEKMYRINVLGSIFPTRLVIPSMKEKKRGTIIFVSSQVAQAAIYGYTAYGASKWAIRGLAEALQMELKPYNISVSVSYPPDTDTPGYKEEMLTKPLITKKISETGSVFSAVDVAATIVAEADQQYFSIATGSDGWLLKQLHPGMTPLNNVFEVAQQVLFASFFRLVAVIYLSYWDYLVSYYLKHDKQQPEEPKKNK